MVEAFKTRGYGGVSLNLSHTYLWTFKLMQISKTEAHRARWFYLHSDQLSVGINCFKIIDLSCYLKVLFKSLFCHLLQDVLETYSSFRINNDTPLPTPYAYI